MTVKVLNSQTEASKSLRKGFVKPLPRTLVQRQLHQPAHSQSKLLATRTRHTEVIIESDADKRKLNVNVVPG